MRFTPQGAPAAISWIAGAAASAGGFPVSFRYDLPTGPMVVYMSGLLLVTYGVRRVLGMRTDTVLEPAAQEADRSGRAP